MQKVKKQLKQIPQEKVQPSYPALELAANHFIFNKWFQYALIFIVSIAIYSNTIIGYDYTLDDVIVITKNNFTLKGFDGIKDILTKDTFDGYTSVKNLVAGGRYRPLSVVTFAIEIGLFGPGHPARSHFINVLLYGIMVLLLFKLMRDHLFKNNSLIALIAALIFAIHPIHTEVVANIKSRDEIMASMFIFLSLHLFFNYQGNKKISSMILSFVCFFFSLMSKETVLTYNAVIPLIFYFFYKKSFGESIVKTLPFIGVTVLFLMMRFRITGFSAGQNNDILNSPYLYATPVEAFATKVWVMLRYLWLLFFPHPLTYDYTYNQIPYIKLSNLKFLISAAINLFLIAYALIKMKTRSIISFSILVYFIALSIVANFVFDVGAPMGERFLFHSSIGFSILAAYAIMNFVYNSHILTFDYRKILSIGSVILILLMGSFKTIDRNKAWKNEDVLYVVDGEVSSNSAHATMNSAVSYVNLANKAADSTLKKMYFRRGISQFKKAIVIHPKFADAYVNMGATYYMLKNTDSTAFAWEMAKKYSPAHPLLPGYFQVLSNLCYNEGLQYYQKGSIEKAREYYEKALRYNDKNVEALYNLGGSYLIKGDTKKAREYWERVLQINPNHPEVNKWISQIPK